MTKRSTKPAKPSKTDLDRVVEPLHKLLLRIEDLTPDKENPVVHDQDSIQSVAKSLTTYKQDQPIVVQREGMVVRKGNGRYTAAQGLGWEWIAAVVVDEEDVPAISRAIADNRSSEFRKWNYERLFAVVDWLKGAGWDEVQLGYTSDEIRDLVQKYQSEPDLGFTDGLDIEGGDGGQIDIPAIAHVRMAHLFFTDETHEEFERLAGELATAYGTDNQSDTVLKALEEGDQVAQEDA